MSFAPPDKIRIVTAAALFDGHDAAINIMRRILQSKGAEVIHLGHNRSVLEIVECAIEEDAQAIAITSYQGGHVEFFKYMKDLLDENGCSHIKIFGGGGGTILPVEIEHLHNYGITRIYSPDDGRQMGLEGMIEDLIKKAGIHTPSPQSTKEKAPLPTEGGFPDPADADLFALGESRDIKKIAKAITLAENGRDYSALTAQLKTVSLKLKRDKNPGSEGRGPVLGITGTGGAGKSSVTDEIVRRFLNNYTDRTIAVISVDPSKKKTGGALLGDRIRMNAISSPRAYMRSLATRESDKALSRYVQQAIDICKAAEFDFIILESAGVGQSDASILDFVDVSMYVMTPEYGAASQLEKINMLDYADVVCVNKFDKAGAQDALHEVCKQYKRNHNLWNAKDDELPVVGTIAAQFNDDGINELFERLMEKVAEKTGVQFDGAITHHEHTKNTSSQSTIIPAKRVRYLAEIAEEIERYNKLGDEQSAIASKLYQLNGALQLLKENIGKWSKNDDAMDGLAVAKTELEKQLFPVCKKLVEEWEQTKARYRKDFFEYDVRGKIIKQALYFESLSHTRIPKIAVPGFKDWGDILRWRIQENFPGKFPYTAGVFPLKRAEEDPTRMFAGEGGPERTNRRFHYVSFGQPAKRLSTAFDSVTLYGEDPAHRPDIYGKVGNSGVSIATVDDAKKLYSGFDLCDPKTSVSMTINGPAPMLLAFFMNVAIDQQCEKYILENNLREEVNRLIESKFDIETLPRYIAEDGGPIHHTQLPKLTGPAEYFNNTLTAGEASNTPSAAGAAGLLPEGNNGLGLRLLGLSGEDVLPKEVYEKIKAKALSTVRGTVQADILKEDQAQNTCIFSTEFALKLMGDVQEYFIENHVQNFYSVSISGYHIAEAGANPISQLAFTLANGFTYVEYYLSRGMQIDDFAPNLSFFFSNGMDPEYSVIGRVARRVWAKAMKHKYNANSRSQKLKYHIQTSGRSLHAQEIDFNDIRTTLQALYAIYDNCNSLHTNAYDEAITTPTEESVRRAMAIQLIINRELGTAKNENPNQGSFLLEELTDLVEDAVMKEFHRLAERGGVLGAMERMYQRNKIQEESLYYETLKHTGELPIIGVNTFLNKNGSPTILPTEVIRSTTDEKETQVKTVHAFHERHAAKSADMLNRLKQVAVSNGNLFAELMETVKYCSLGQVTNALYAVGGQYRRNM
ncbi:MAG: methylmalonyl-CoA mutase family protein [Ferruginibacter sp.]|nr:methylmalonyl-CoA mutase family protein [Ferruginibacter sp.]